MAAIFCPTIRLFLYPAALRTAAVNSLFVLMLRSAIITMVETAVCAAHFFQPHPWSNTYVNVFTTLDVNVVMLKTCLVECSSH